MIVIQSNNSAISHAGVMDMSTGVFAFRMLVCQFRRELVFVDVFDFWERLWAAERLANCQLKVCLNADIAQLGSFWILFSNCGIDSLFTCSC